MSDGAEVRIRPLVVSRFALDGGAMFGVIPRPLWERKHPADERGRIDLVARVLVARFPRQGRTAVIDAGLGTVWGERDADRYKVDPLGGDLGQILAREGIDPESVTDAVVTHLHFDHAGGWVRTDDSGRVVPVFERAAHHVQRAQLDWARAPSPRDRGSYLEPLIAPLEQRGLLRPVDGEGELFPGLELIVSRGHTPGLQIPLLRGPGGVVVFPADLIPTRAHGRDSWIMAYDLEPLATLAEKQRFLDRAAAEGWVLVFEHDPLVEAATVELVDGERVLNPCACPREL